MVNKNMSFNSFYLTESVKEETKSNVFSISSNKKSIIIKKIVAPIVKSSGVKALLELFVIAKKKKKKLEVDIGTNFDSFCEELKLMEYTDGIRLVAAILLEDGR